MDGGGGSRLRPSLCNVTRPFKKLSTEDDRGSPSRLHLADQVRTPSKSSVAFYFDHIIICRLGLSFSSSLLIVSHSTNGVELNDSSLSVLPFARLLICMNFIPFFSPSSSSRSSMLRYAVTLCLLALTLAQDCQVQNIQVKENFDRNRVSSRTRRTVPPRVRICSE